MLYLARNIYNFENHFYFAPIHIPRACLSAGAKMQTHTRTQIHTILH